jgi:hypothetical protein
VYSQNHEGPNTKNGSKELLGQKQGRKAGCVGTIQKTISTNLELLEYFLLSDFCHF